MGDDQEAIQVPDDFLWPSPEMRQRAIDEAVKLIGVQIAEKFEKQADNTIQVMLKKAVTELDVRISELTRLYTEAQQAILSLQSIKQHDFAKITDELTIRMTEIEHQLLTKDNDQNPLGFNSEYDAKTALKNICEIIQNIVNSVRGDNQYNAIAYNLSDYNLKGRVLGQLITEHAAYQLGTRFDRLDQIGSIAGRL